MADGLKYDNGKRQWSLLERELIEPLIEVFEAGVKKYGRDNWKKGFEDRENRFFDAMQRHAWAAKGKPLAIDEETGCYHKAQVAWNALVDLWYEIQEAKETKL